MRHVWLTELRADLKPATAGRVGHRHPVVIQACRSQLQLLYPRNSSLRVRTLSRRAAKYTHSSHRLRTGASSEGTAGGGGKGDHNSGGEDSGEEGDGSDDSWDRWALTALIAGLGLFVALFVQLASRKNRKIEPRPQSLAERDQHKEKVAKKSDGDHDRQLQPQAQTAVSAQPRDQFSLETQKLR